MKRLLINVGNTHSGVAEVDNQNIIQIIKQCKTSELCTYLTGLDLSTYSSIWGASVVGSINEGLGNLVKWIDPTLNHNINFSGDDYSTLGGDRLANAVAAASAYDSAVLVIDCGTAITTELIDRHKTFLGGTILPGRQLQLRSLAENTDALPLIEMIDDQCLNAASGNTLEAIQSGVNLVLLGGLERLIRESRVIVDGDLQIVITGGDKHFYATSLSLFASSDTFTFEGINIIANMNAQ